MIRKRLQLLDDVPAVSSASYYPMWLASGTRLESPEALPEGPDNLIERLGHEFARGLELLRIDYDPDGRTLQVADDLYAGDQHEFAFEWEGGDRVVAGG